MNSNGHPERLRTYYDDGLKVYYRAAKAPRDAEPIYVCTAAGRNLAKRIAAALNLYVPKREREAVQRRELNAADQTAVATVKRAFRAGRAV